MALQELGSLVYRVLHCNIVAPSNAQATQEQVNIAVWGLTTSYHSEPHHLCL